MKQKKAQIKFGESIGVILIVFLIIFSGLIWYNKINTKNLDELYQKDQESKSFEKYHYLINLDLIRLSQRGDIDDIFDLDSLIVFSDYSKTKIGKKYLRERLGFSKIKLSIYTFDDINKSNSLLNLTLYENLPNSNTAYDTKTFISLIPVKNQSTTQKKITYIGLLEIKTYIIKK